jgi:DNA repair exonuclease SbcCD ATPase subunit
LATRNYKAQAIWFLNAFWNDFAGKEADNVWDYTHRHQALDPNKADGTELDELLAHRFLEQINSTMTVAELRDYIRSIGVDKVRYVPLTHYLLARYKADLKKLVNAKQADNQDEIDKAQSLLDAAQAALTHAQKAAKEASDAEAELKAALADLHAQEHAFNSRTEELTKKTTEGSVVGQNKAKAELAQHLASDPLPLRRSKLNTEAATRKAEKARAAAEAALNEAQKRFEEADAYLKEVSSRSGSAKGALWWIDRELQEARKYMPTKKGGVAKSNFALS